MSRVPIIAPLAAGALLTFGCATGRPTTPTDDDSGGSDPEERPTAPDGSTSNQEAGRRAPLPIGGNPPPPRPPPEPPEPPVFRNPPPPRPRPVPPASLPAYDEVKSGHPERATNPPIPSLVVTPDAACYKLFSDPRLRSGQPEVRTDCDDSSVHCGIPVRCPPEATKVLADHKAAQQGGE